jgi:hypothetical protein
MQKGSQLQFSCQSCKHPVIFSLFEIDHHQHIVTCSTCGKKYSFEDETLRRQLSKFTALCRQIYESEEILGHTAIGIDIGEHHVKIPYKLLLTRLNSSLELSFGDQPLTISFRIEPIAELKGANHGKK